MTLIADTGALYAAFDRDDQHHGAVVRYLRTVDAKPIVPPLVLAELDHLALARHGESPLGLTDASVMVVAFEHQTHDILTTGQRHFRAVRPLLGGPAAAYRLLPFDA